ncbi:short chain dehydrogenase/reductase [Aspergillus pseudoustus]|uniref:Short chain dehydrogenase/reductase n=1 Tax=Aspergillus pseudoustus TaxID=1810923 RepID=A0ABR4JPS5_9EURO
MSSVVLVTGGASGIGFEICQYFLRKKDAHVVILDNNPSSGSVAVGKLTAEFSNASVSFIECNAASWPSQAAAFEQVYNQHGRIDIVFANAGISEKEPIYGADVTKLQEPSLSVVDVNVNGVIYSINLAVHYMAKNAPHLPSESSIPLRGQIICTSSCAGIYPFSTLPLYTASKHAVVGLVRSLGRPLALPKLQIQINAFAPGPIMTSFSANAEVYQNLFTTPLSTVAKALNMLMESRDVTGQVFELHGEYVTLAKPPTYQHEETGKNIEYYWSLGHI